MGHVCGCKVVCGVLWCVQCVLGVFMYVLCVCMYIYEEPVTVYELI